jgi:hypothetical protein
LRRWVDQGYMIGRGTYTENALRQHYRGHDRVLVLTDEQAGYGGHSYSYVGHELPPHVKMYAWNLAGYRYGQMPAGPNRVSIAGLTDSSFRLIPLLERGANDWPF